MEILLEGLTRSRASGVLYNPPGLETIMDILLEGFTQSRASGVLCNPSGLDSVMEILLEGLTRSRASSISKQEISVFRRFYHRLVTRSDF